MDALVRIYGQRARAVSDNWTEFASKANLKCAKRMAPNGTTSIPGAARSAQFRAYTAPRDMCRKYAMLRVQVQD